MLEKYTPGSEDVESEIPLTEEVKSNQIITTSNHPNPFNPSTSINFNLPKATYCKLSIFNSSGQLVTKLVSNRLKKGLNSVVWHGLNQKGNTAASGFYFYIIEAEGFKTVKRKMLLLK